MTASILFIHHNGWAGDIYLAGMCLVFSLFLLGWCGYIIVAPELGEDLFMSMILGCAAAVAWPVLPPAAVVTALRWATQKQLKKKPKVEVLAQDIARRERELAIGQPRPPVCPHCGSSNCRFGLCQPPL